MWEVADARVLVIGGGPAGCSVALALAKAGVNCLVVESGDGSEVRFGECLPPTAKPLLAGIGMWDTLTADGHLPCLGNRSIWGSDSVREYDFLFSRYGNGWSLDRTRFEQRLAEVAQLAGARRLESTCVRECMRDSGVWSVTLECRGATASIRPELIVDATGRRSWFALHHGASRLRDDSMIGVAACLETPGSADRDCFTLVETVENGWWYSAFLPGDRLAAAFLTDGDLIDPHAVRDPACWLALLDRAPHTRERVSEARGQFVRNPKVLDAGTGCLDRVAGEGWVAVGDAAASFDPLSSHGITTAIAGGQYCSKAVLSAFAGAPEAWDEYAAGIRALVESSRRQRSAYYAAETRWLDSPFWSRRVALT
jgi:flavin-dependent dehydrogenase